MLHLIYPFLLIYINIYLCVLKKLIDFLESDIEILDDEDFSYYEDVTGIDTDSLGELYIGYGFNANKYKETDKLKAEYEKSSKKTWKQVSDEADDAE